MTGVSPVLTEIANRLQRAIEELFSQRLAIAESSSATSPCIAVSDVTGGDPYSGYTTVGSVTVRGLTVKGAPVVIEFQFTGHETSGQCDAWTARVAGVPESTRERFRRVFDPSQIARPWSAPSNAVFELNGTRV